MNKYIFAIPVEASQCSSTFRAHTNAVVEPTSEIGQLVESVQSIIIILLPISSRKTRWRPINAQNNLELNVICHDICNETFLKGQRPNDQNKTNSQLTAKMAIHLLVHSLLLRRNTQGIKLQRTRLECLLRRVSILAEKDNIYKLRKNERALESVFNPSMSNFTL